MQVKKFEAPTLQEALDTVKRELGPEAIILQTKKNRKGFGLLSKSSVEITAAVSQRSLQKKQLVEKRMPDQVKQKIEKLPAGKQADLYSDYLENHLDKLTTQTQDQVEIGAKKGPAKKQIIVTPYIDIRDDVHVPAKRADLPTYSRPAQSVQSAETPGPAKEIQNEMRQLKEMILEMKRANEQRGGSGAQALMSSGSFSTGALQSGFEHLVLAGIDKRYASTLVRQVAFALGKEREGNADDVLDQLAVELMENIEVGSLLDGVLPPIDDSPRAPKTVALVGSTGVGKTTTVAKIASEAVVKRKLKVGLINLDAFKVAAFDQLATFAKILRVPFRSVASKEDLDLAIQDLHACDLILIDTTGRSQKDQEALKEMGDLLGSVPGVKTQLVLSATTRDAELYDMGKRFEALKPEGLIFSKLDEAMTYGAIYNLSQKLHLPLLYFTTGQRVPEDLEEATRERVAALILDL